MDKEFQHTVASDNCLIQMAKLVKNKRDRCATGGSKVGNVEKEIKKTESEKQKKVGEIYSIIEGFFFVIYRFLSKCRCCISAVANINTNAE